MSETSLAKVKKDTLASGAQPRPEGRVRERGWRPTRKGFGIAELLTEAARRLAHAPTPDTARHDFRTRAMKAR